MARIPMPYRYVTGPIIVVLACPRCKVTREHERHFDPTWGLVMRTCLGCGLEEVDKPVR